MMSAFVNGCGFLPDRFGGDRDQQDRHDDARDDKQADAVGIVGLGMLADHARFPACRAAKRTRPGTDRRHVEPGHRSQRPIAEQLAPPERRSAARHEREEARRRDLVADGSGFAMGPKRNETARFVQ